MLISLLRLLIDRSLRTTGPIFSVVRNDWWFKAIKTQSAGWVRARGDIDAYIVKQEIGDKGGTIYELHNLSISDDTRSVGVELERSW